jgi:outer membrane murein-binding lipoprotein Lpp
MKKTELKLLALLLTVILLAGCTSQMDRDANKMAKRVVEFEQVQKRMEDRSNLGGKRMSEQEFQQYAKEYMEYANKMLEKYSETPDQKHEFYQLVEKKAKEMKNK